MKLEERPTLDGPLYATESPLHFNRDRCAERREETRDLLSPCLWDRPAHLETDLNQAELTRPEFCHEELMTLSRPAEHPHPLSGALIIDRDQLPAMLEGLSIN